VEAPNGAHFTDCAPDYSRDEAFQRRYARSAASPEAWAEFRSAYLEVGEADYQKAVKAS
jgi:glutaconate CoA-transferase subunit A